MLSLAAGYNIVCPGGIYGIDSYRTFNSLQPIFNAATEYQSSKEQRLVMP